RRASPGRWPTPVSRPARSRPRRRLRPARVAPVGSRYNSPREWGFALRITPMKPALKIAVAGLGTVGAGTVQLLDRQAELVATRAGRHIVVAAVSARDRRR